MVEQGVVAVGELGLGEGKQGVGHDAGNGRAAAGAQGAPEPKGYCRSLESGVPGGRDPPGWATRWFVRNREAVQCRRGADRAIAVPKGIEEGPDSIGRDSG
ncbi:hypothetical protein GCM10009108_14310 [Castellaniella ginsengisoli]|uniref:Uncharacterized protein n=1 Tax=Castellaniella ginsengisoli TaxID=546114 RepID=A0ABN1KWX7_9BURK